MEVTLDVVNMVFLGGKEAGLSISPTIDLLGFSQPSPVRIVQKKRKYPVAVVWRNLVIVSVQRRMNRLVENENGEWK